MRVAGNRCGALQTEGAGCTLSGGRELKIEIASELLVVWHFLVFPGIE